jgi:hypothetical protein
MYLDNYLKYNEGNECPQLFHLWGGLTTLSVAIGRRVFIDMGYFTIYCNVYACLIGPQGGRKTVACDIALDVLREAIPDIVVSASCETRQGITNFMQQDAQKRVFHLSDGKEQFYRPYAMFLDELMNWISIDPKGMVDFLTAVYDRKVYDYRLKNEQHFLENPYFVMLACTTPAWLLDAMKQATIAGGFSRRVIFICADEDKRIPFPSISEDALKAKNFCVQWLRKVQKVSGEFVFSPEARDYYSKWYIEPSLPDDEFLRGWYKSRHIQVLKTAMLYTLSTHPNDLTLGVTELQFAINAINDIEKNIPMLSAVIGRSELAVPAERILHILRAHSGFLLEKQLALKTFKDFKSPFEYQQVIDHLRRTDQVRFVDDKTTGVTRRIVALPEIVDRLNVKKEP